MSRTPEGQIKDALRRRVEALGGEVVFVKYIGRRNCPDTRIRFPADSAARPDVGNCWVETKAGKNGRLSVGQKREIQRMIDFGETVLVIIDIESINREFPL